MTLRTARHATKCGIGVFVMMVILGFASETDVSHDYLKVSGIERRCGLHTLRISTDSIQDSNGDGTNLQEPVKYHRSELIPSTRR